MVKYFNYLQLFIYGITFSFLLTACSSMPKTPLKTVNQVDMNRYLGKWIEIARYENSFEKGCYGASAQYALTQDSISVVNRCYDKNGTLINEALGDAYVADSSNAKLKVTFFWPFYGDYQIIMLGDDYSYSVVGEPSRKYLWILSRSKQLKTQQKEEILKQLPAFGYDPAKLYWTEVRP